MKFNIKKPILILMSHIKLGDFLILTPLLQAIQKSFPQVKIIVPDLLIEIYREKNIFSPVENAVDKTHGQVLDLTFPLIENIKTPSGYFKLEKKFFEKNQHVFYNYKEALAEFFGDCFSAQMKPEPFLELNPAKHILSKYNLNSFAYFTVHAGSDYAPKNWDPGNFEKAIRQVLKANPKLKCVSLVGPSDDELFLTSQPPSGFQTVKASLIDVVHILSGSLFHLDNDSGIHHLAGALNVPSITVFGPTGPGTWASLTPYNFIHWGGPSCLDHCGGARMAECGDRVCLTSIKVESVVESTTKILSQYNHLGS